MKLFNPKLMLRWSASLALGLAVSLSSCKDDDPILAAPTVTLSTAAASSTAGSKVTTSVQVDSPEGGKTLTILVNGVANSALPDVTLDGTTAQTVPVEFTIPATASIGQTFGITFVATDMKDQSSTQGVFTVTVSDVAAKQIVDIGTYSTNTGITYTTDQHWTADKIYRINGFVRIGADTHSGNGVAPKITGTATLTIDAGTVIIGRAGTPGGTLIIQRGSKLVAIGTAAKPIIFTSEKVAGTRKAGDWGGLVLCGLAQNNITGSISTGENGVEELEGAYGGFHGGISGAAADIGTLNNADNSGTIQYVRVEFAGYPINPNQEINGITFGSVGSGTTFDHVQVTYSNDDSFEWFGGTVKAKNLIAYKGLDDDFDTDNGFSGKVQFGLGIRDQNIADQSGSNGFESDNDANGSNNLPYTSAQFVNMTIIGGKAVFNTTINLQFQNGAQIRRNSQLNVINSLITGYPNGIFIDDTKIGAGASGVLANAAAGSLLLKANVLAGVDGWGGNGFGSKATDDELSVLGIANAGANAANVPRGLAVAGGKTGSFANGVFAFPGTAGAAGVQGGGGGNYVESTISGVTPINWFNVSNKVIAKWSDATVGLNANVFEPLNGNPTLGPTGALLTSGADWSWTPDGFFKQVSYRGAFGTDGDWTTGGWVNWNPQLTDYSK